MRGGNVEGKLWRPSQRGLNCAGRKIRLWLKRKVSSGIRARLCKGNTMMDQKPREVEDCREPKR